MKLNAVKLVSFAWVLIIICCAKTYAQNNMPITLADAEQQFVQKNLQLLADKYNISISQAQVVQAKLYPNPIITLSGNGYDPNNKKFINVGAPSGDYTVALQQLVRLAGKRNKEVKLAETATTLSTDKFTDLLRTLRYSLRSNFYNIYYLQYAIKSYKKQIASLQNLDSAYNNLQEKGIVTLKESVRIRALMYSLKTDQANLQNQENDLQSQFQLLLQNSKVYFVPIINEDKINGSVKLISLQSLIDTAYANRYDLILAANTLTYSEQNYKLQKAMATPDVTLAALYDRRGAYINSSTFLSVAIDLPFFNRNQGNIRAAKFNIEQSKLMEDLQKETVENDVNRAYKKAVNAENMLASIDPKFHNQFDKLLQGITENFTHKNLNLTELTDFYDAYRNSVLQLNQLQNDKMQAMELLNFATGKTIFN